MFEKLLKAAEGLSETSVDDVKKIAGEDEKGNGQGKGLKETTEVIEALTLITVFLTQRLKDGIGADDAMALMQKIMSDPEFMDVFARAADGVAEIPGELSDLDFEESLTLGILGLNFIKEVVGALKED